MSPFEIKWAPVVRYVWIPEHRARKQSKANLRDPFRVVLFVYCGNKRKTVNLGSNLAEHKLDELDDNPRWILTGSLAFILFYCIKQQKQKQKQMEWESCWGKRVKEGQVWESLDILKVKAELMNSLLGE